jgi:hypothetical protein
MDASCAWNCVAGKFMIMFSLALSSVTTFHTRLLQESSLFSSILSRTDTQYAVRYTMTDTAALVYEKFSRQLLVEFDEPSCSCCQKPESGSCVIMCKWTQGITKLVVSRWGRVRSVSHVPLRGCFPVRPQVRL